MFFQAERDGTFPSFAAGGSCCFFRQEEKAPSLRFVQEVPVVFFRQFRRERRLFFLLHTASNGGTNREEGLHFFLLFVRLFRFLPGKDLLPENSDPIVHTVRTGSDDSTGVNAF